jgi:hypothetical protein
VWSDVYVYVRLATGALWDQLAILLCSCITRAGPKSWRPLTRWQEDMCKEHQLVGLGTYEVRRLAAFL